MKASIRQIDLCTSIDDENNLWINTGLFSWCLESKNLGLKMHFSGEFRKSELLVYCRQPIRDDSAKELPLQVARDLIIVVSNHIEARGFVPLWVLYDDSAEHQHILARLNYLAIFKNTQAGKFIDLQSSDPRLSDQDRAALWLRGLQKFVKENPGCFGHTSKGLQ